MIPMTVANSWGRPYSNSNSGQLRMLYCSPRGPWWVVYSLPSTGMPRDAFEHLLFHPCVTFRHSQHSVCSPSSFWRIRASMAATSSALSSVGFNGAHLLPLGLTRAFVFFRIAFPPSLSVILLYHTSPWKVKHFSKKK